MILSDKDLRARLKKDLVIHPLDAPDVQIQPASVDLRLGREFRLFKEHLNDSLDPFLPKCLNEAMYLVTAEEDGDSIVKPSFVLDPGEFVLAHTVEAVKIPADLVAQVNGRSSIGRLGVVVHATAGFIDPGFEGQITLELGNIGPRPVKLYPGMRIAQLVVCKMTSAAEIPYGVKRDSKYQGQKGATASRIDGS